MHRLSPYLSPRPLAYASVFAGLVAAAPAWADDDYWSETRVAPRTYTVTSTAATSHIDTEDARTGQSDTARLLEREPDLRVRRTGGLNGPAFVSIRGAEPNATRFSLDGTPIHGASVTVLDVNALLPEMLSRMDVYRTTAPIALGPAAPGGIVDLRLRDSSSAEAWAVAGWGRWMTRKLAAAVTIPTGDGHLRIAGSYRGSRGDFRFYNTNGTDANPYDDNPNERRQNNDFNQGSLLLIRDQRVNDWRLRLMSMTDMNEAGVSGIDIAQAKYARTSRIQQFIAFDARTRVGKADRTDLSFVASLAALYSTYHDRKGEIGNGRQDRTDQQVLGFLAARSSTWLPHNLSIHAAIDAQIEHNHPHDTFIPPIIYSSTRFLPSGGAELRWHTDDRRLSLSAGARQSFYIQNNDSRDVPAAPERHVMTPAFSPQFGITGRPVDTDTVAWDLFGYASRTHRQPGFDELFGDNGGSVGNDQLKVERQTGLEVGTRLKWEKGMHGFEVRFNLWHHWRQDAIEYVALATGVRKPFNVPGARVFGQDLAIGYTSGPATILLSGTHMTSRNDSADPQQHGKDLPWRSPWAASIDASVRPIPHGPMRGFEFTGNFRYDDPFYADLRNNRMFPDRLELDVGVAFDPKIGNVPAVRFEAMNVLNRRVTDLPGRDGGEDIRMTRPISDYAGYPRPGRGFFVTLNWTLKT